MAICSIKIRYLNIWKCCTCTVNITFDQFALALLILLNGQSFCVSAGYVGCPQILSEFLAFIALFDRLFKFQLNCAFGQTWMFGNSVLCNIAFDQFAVDRPGSFFGLASCQFSQSFDLASSLHISAPNSEWTFMNYWSKTCYRPYALPVIQHLPSSCDSIGNGKYFNIRTVELTR